MLTNYLRTAWRRLRKNKGFFALNFIGLYISVTASLLIAVLIIYELSFDKGSPAGVQVYRIVNKFRNEHGPAYNAVTPYPLAAALRVAMPDEKLITQIHYATDGSVLIGTEVTKEKNIVFADSVFPRLFPLTVVEGSIDRAFREPGFAVLTESTANRFFGKTGAIGKRIKLSGVLDVQVAAVVADAPPNTHLPYRILVSYRSLTTDFIGGMPLDQWSLAGNGYTYIGLSNPNAVGNTERVIAGLVKSHARDTTEHPNFVLQPLRAIHYDMDYAATNPSYTINSGYLGLVGAIGLFLILAACINYTNLSTAMALRKSKEVGVRKTLGATRSQLMRMILAETFVLTGIVIVGAAVTAGYFLPLLNEFLDKNIPASWLTFTSGGFLVLLWVIVAVLSGIYPATVLSGFRPVIALKSTVTTPKASVVLLRRGLVVFQFVTAQVLIICAIVVYKQMEFVNDRPLGFAKDLVFDVNLPSNKPAELRALRSRLEGISGISRISLSLGAPVSQNNVGTGFNRREEFKRQQFDVAIKAADKDYLATYGLELVAGRWIDAGDEQRVDKSIPDSLRQYSFVLNETAAKTLGFKTPQDAIGKQVTFGLNQISAPVIGVVKDYHIASLHSAVMPVIMTPFPFFYYTAGIRLSGGYSPATMKAIEKAYDEVYPHQYFGARFLDADVAGLYTQERRTQQLFNLFTGLSIAINVLGLIGLLSFMIEQKTREVGIRKVLGASMQDISFLLSKDFLRLIGIAFLIAAPVAGLLMHHWLQEFAYRTGLSWWVFAGALLCTLVVTCVAISFQTIRAAVANPVRSLRAE